MKILVIQQKMIGDVLTSTVICETLKANYPNCVIHYLINNNTKPVAVGNPFIDKIVALTSEHRKNKWTLFKFITSIKNEKYTWVIDSYGKIESNLISLFSGAAVKSSFYKPYSKFIYTHTMERYQVSKNGCNTSIEHRLNLLEKLVDTIDYSITPKIYLSTTELEAAAKKLKKIKTNKLLMVSILGSSTSKTYPHNYMAKILDTVVKNTKAILLVNYIPSQLEEVTAIYNKCESITKQNILLDIYGKDLREFLAITAHCNALIGNEGGATNMAKALNIPTFSIFSPQISKSSWNHGEDDSKNMSVHILDFIETPEIIDSKKLYAKFTPDLIIPKLNTFLSKNLS